MTESTKKQLAEALHDADTEIGELKGFLDTTKAKLKAYDGVFQGIIAIHAPYADTSALMSCADSPPAVVLRCTVCDTPEHHTWANDNDEVWPCPTLRLFVTTRLDLIEAP